MVIPIKDTVPEPRLAAATGERQNRDRLELLALIPAWNEASTIADVIAGVMAQLDVLVIDDGSREATADVARAAGATVVSHATNRGKGAALLTGFAWAMEHGYDAVVTLDADGQHDPEDLGAFIEAYRAGAGDLIIGERDFTVMPFPRWFTQPIGAWLVTWATGVRHTDCQCGFRVLSRELIEGMRLTANGFDMEIEMIWEAVRLGLTVGWVPIRTIYLPGRRSGFHPVKDTLRFFRRTWRIRQARRRLEADRLTRSDEEEDACLGQRTIS